MSKRAAAESTESRKKTVQDLVSCSKVSQKGRILIHGTRVRRSEVCVLNGECVSMEDTFDCGSCGKTYPEDALCETFDRCKLFVCKPCVQKIGYCDICKLSLLEGAMYAGNGSYEYDIFSNGANRLCEHCGDVDEDVDGDTYTLDWTKYKDSTALVPCEVCKQPFDTEQDGIVSTYHTNRIHKQCAMPCVYCKVVFAPSNPAYVNKEAGRAVCKKCCTNVKCTKCNAFVELASGMCQAYSEDDEKKYRCRTCAE